MCGIAGFTGARRHADPATIAWGMLEPIRHRGPDGDGVRVAGDCALAHLRLAVVDLAGGAQPRVDPATGDALVFNGEIYGYRALAAELTAAGVELADRSDTEILFRLLQREGIERVLARIDGMFAFAFVEGATGVVHLARDRFGEKPLYWGARDGALVFASEPRSLRRHPAWADASVDDAAVARFLHFEYLPGERALWRGVRKLMPGTRLRFADGEATTHRYWVPEPGVSPTVAEDEAARIDRLDALLDVSVRERLIADVPVGVFLSGGIDSSLVATYAARHAPGITAFTVAMPEASYDETPAARLLAERLGMRHEVLPLDDAALYDAFDALCTKLDEPFADSSLLATWVVCRAARRHVTVALGGDGADELFAGYLNFKADRFSGAMRHVPPVLGGLLRAALGTLARDEGYMSLDFKLRQLSHGFGLPPERQWSAWMAPFAPEDLAALWRAPPAAGAEDDLVAELGLADGAPWSTARLLSLFTRSYLPEDILLKVDRASMWNSLEVRAPFLARGFAEYALSLPSSDKIAGGETKRLFRKLARRHIPAEIIDRPKHGFAVPLAGLLRGTLKVRVGDMLLDPASPLWTWFRRDAVERLWHEHQSRRRDHRKRLWTLFTLAVAARG